MKFAYFGYPHTGGTFTVFQQLRNGLEQYGIQVDLVGYSDIGEKQLNAPEWQEACNYYRFISVDSQEVSVKGRAFVEFIEQSDYDGIFMNVLSGQIEMNSVRYIRKQLIKIMIVHSLTDGTYRAVKAFDNYVHKTICVSWRIQEDLINHYELESQKVKVIPTGVSLEAYQGLSQRSTELPIKILSLSRIEDSSKGVFWLPKIMSYLSHLKIELTIAGDGPDLRELKRKFEHHQIKANFLGQVEASKVPEICAQHHIFLMTSRYEGLGLALIEAMASGCVPVASNIAGSIDQIIQDQETGLLFPVGDVKQAAQCIEALVRDSERRMKFSQACQATIAARFSSQIMAESYVEVIHELVKNPTQTTPPLSLDHWQLPNALTPRFPSFIPAPVVNLIRNWRLKKMMASS